MRLTEAQVIAHCQRIGRPCPTLAAAPAEAKAPRRRVLIGGVYRSKLESSYALRLSLLELAGEIDGWAYEPAAFMLGGRRKYRPDFIVWKGGRAEAHEVKGYAFERDRIRLDWFVAAYPALPLVIVRQLPKRNGGGWDFERREATGRAGMRSK